MNKMTAIVQLFNENDRLIAEVGVGDGDMTEKEAFAKARTYYWKMDDFMYEGLTKGLEWCTLKLDVRPYGWMTGK